MKIKDLPKFNRPGSKLLKEGAESLDTAELLSIIFGVGSKGESAIELSNRLLKKYNLHHFEDLGFNELLKECKGSRDKEEIGDYIKSLKILSLIELSKRYNKLINKGYKRNIRSAKDVYDLLVDKYGNKKKEHFICLFLDTKNNIIKEEVIFVGTLNSSLIHPREIFKSAIKESANSIILVHNHPSGDCNPSENDIRFTKALLKAGKIIDIKVLDHIIIGNENYFSIIKKQ